MTPGEVGLLLVALMYQWREGSLPDDVTKIALLMGWSGRQVDRSWPAVRAVLEVRKDGTLLSPRMHLERRKIERMRKTWAKAGKDGAIARWRKASVQMSSDSLPMARPFQSDGVPDHIQTRDTRNKNQTSIEGAETAVDQVALIEELRTVGLDEPTARRLAQAHPDESRRQLQALALRTDVTNPAGYLVKAITEAYSIPSPIAAQVEKRSGAQRLEAAKKRIARMGDDERGRLEAAARKRFPNAEGTLPLAMAQMIADHPEAC